MSSWSAAADRIAGRVSRALDSPGGRRALKILAIVLALGYAFTCSHKQLSSGNDFPIYWQASRTLWGGASPYDVASGLHGYVYLPFFALVLAPLAALPLPVAVWVWYAINVVLYVLIVRQIVLLLRPVRPAGVRWIAVGAALGTARFVLDNLALGQVNVLITFLLLLVARELIERRDDRAGWALGVLLAIKPYAIVLTPYLVLRRRFRALVVTGLSFVVAGLLLPVVMVGPSRTAELLGDWRAKLVEPAVRGELQGSRIWDQSPVAGLRRLTHDDPAFGETAVNVASLSPGAYRAAAAALRLGLAAAVVAGWILSLRLPDRAGWLVGLALAHLATLILFGHSLKAHFVALVLPIAVAIWLAEGAGAAPRSRWMTLVTGVSIGLLVLTSSGIIGRTASDWAHAYSTVAVAALGLLVVLVAGAGQRGLLGRSRSTG